MKNIQNNEQAFIRIDSNFYSRGVKCAGWLYLPDGIQNPPVIIMAHGFAAERTFGLPLFAEKFVREKMAVFLFDYRSFGDSDGTPRFIVNPFKHCKDWEAAIKHIKTLDLINSTKIALWGTSFAGGHVLRMAARHHDISAVVAQVPFVNGVSSLFTVKFKDYPKAFFAATKDLARMIFRLSPHYVHSVSSPDKFAAMNTEESLEGYKSMIPDISLWKNKVAARILFTLPFYSPMRTVKNIKCPVLIVAALNDSLIPFKAVEKTVSKIKNSRFMKLDSGHFDLYHGNTFEKVIKAESEFIKKHLKSD